MPKKTWTNEELELLILNYALSNLLDEITENPENEILYRKADAVVKISETIFKAEITKTKLLNSINNLT